MSTACTSNLPSGAVRLFQSNPLPETMTMKRSLSGCILLLAAGGTDAGFAASAGNIQFNGELTATTCDVSIDGQGPDATVTLPTISTSQFSYYGKGVGRTSFVMELSNCTGSQGTVSAFFESGPTVDATSGLLLNTGGTASRIALELLDGTTGNQVHVGYSSQVSENAYVDISSGSAQLPYAVQYIGTQPTPPGPGTVASNVTYSLQYK